MRIPVNRAKGEIEAAATAAGIPMSLILLGNFAEFALGTPYVSTYSSFHDTRFALTRFQSYGRGVP